ncbi:MAG: hypothetical protein HOE11_03590 [Candidatus Diapherotrites archaeon]|jgi:hypothetical protein|nr:hypothetical protein [Candidatus Diapherotrites archaeon]MBT4597216.1 hypothetical protein [Candidatus Diapherotrites archaeon]
MPLKGFVDETRKTTRLMEQARERQASSENNVIDVSQGQAIPKEQLDSIQSQNASSLPSSVKQRAVPSTNPKTDFEKDYLSKQRETSTPGAPNNTKQQIDDRHGNVIANVIKDTGKYFDRDATWEECKHKKDAGGNTYCTEFHSFCAKDKCKRATK